MDGGGCGALPLVYRFTADVTALTPGGWSGRVLVAEGTRKVIEGVLLPEGNVTMEVVVVDRHGSESAPATATDGVVAVAAMNVTAAGGGGGDGEPGARRRGGSGERGRGRGVATPRGCRGDRHLFHSGGFPAARRRWRWRR